MALRSKASHPKRVVQVLHVHLQMKSLKGRIHISDADKGKDKLDDLK